MAEYRLQPSDYPSTFAYHEHRERVPHLEQNWHAGRIYMAAKFIRSVNPRSVCDLGCGDGGLLSVLPREIDAWGYDFCPANQSGWVERGITAYPIDVFNTDFEPKWGELTVVTEVLEHLADPHGAVAWIAKNSRYVVASSPADEKPGGHHDEHIWAWDREGYAALIGECFSILEHRTVDWSQIILGKNLDESINNWS